MVKELGKRLNAMRHEGLFCDFTLYGNGHVTLPMHKIVLVAKSDILRKKITRNENNFLKVDGVSENVLKAFVNYLYLDCVDIEDSYINEFIKLCYDFGVDLSLLQLNQTSKQIDLEAAEQVKHSKLFHCKICEKTFRAETFWLKHIKTHFKNQKPHDVTPVENVTECQSKKDNKMAKLFSCALCQKVFTSKGNLTRHISVVHNNVRSYRCNICSKQFGQKVSLQWHCLSAHKSDEEFKTNGSSSNRIRQSKDHPVLPSKYIDAKEVAGPHHTNTATHTLNVESHDTNNINVHLDLHSSEQSPKMATINSKRKCHICNKMLSNPTNLIAHLLIHKSLKAPRQKKASNPEYSSTISQDENNNVPNYQTDSLPMCHLCGKQFSILRYLTRHLQAVHPISKAFHCLRCKKSFSTRPELKKHQVTHTEFKCNKCYGVFVGKRAYSFHVRSSCGSSLFPNDREIDLDSVNHMGLLGFGNVFS